MLIPAQESFLQKMSERNDVWTLSELKDFPEYSAQRLKELRESELVTTVSRSHGDEWFTSLTITDKGRSLLLETEQQRQKAAEEKKEIQESRKFERRTACISAITGSVAGAITALFVEHFGSIIAFIRTLAK